MELKGECLNYMANKYGGKVAINAAALYTAANGDPEELNKVINRLTRQRSYSAAETAMNDLVLWLEKKQ